MCFSPHCGVLDRGYPILARGTVDDLVMERLSGKRSVQEVLLEAMKRRKT